jgi:hypothetical protein
MELTDHNPFKPIVVRPEVENKFAPGDAVASRGSNF